jgi:4'-phosphopantetheinyl transferase EntD
VASSEAFDDPPDAVLFPAEPAIISPAVDKRRRDFQTVRHCARRAMGELGLPPAAILPGEHREPI